MFFLFSKFSIFSKFPKFGPGVADSGLLLTKQSIRRTGAVLNVLQGEEGASTNGKTHSRASSHTGLVHFTRGAEGAYTIRKTFVILPVRQTRAK